MGLLQLDITLGLAFLAGRLQRLEASHVANRLLHLSSSVLDVARRLATNGWRVNVGEDGRAGSRGWGDYHKPWIRRHVESEFVCGGTDAFGRVVGVFDEDSRDRLGGIIQLRTKDMDVVDDRTGNGDDVDREGIEDGRVTVMMGTGKSLNPTSTFDLLLPGLGSDAPKSS